MPVKRWVCPWIGHPFTVLLYVVQSVMDTACYGTPRRPWRAQSAGKPGDRRLMASQCAVSCNDHHAALWSCLNCRFCPTDGISRTTSSSLWRRATSSGNPRRHLLRSYPGAYFDTSLQTSPSTWRRLIVWSEVVLDAAATMLLACGCFAFVGLLGWRECRVVRSASNQRLVPCMPSAARFRPRLHQRRRQFEGEACQRAAAAGESARILPRVHQPVRNLCRAFVVSCMFRTLLSALRMG